MEIIINLKLNNLQYHPNKFHYQLFPQLRENKISFKEKESLGI